MANFIINNFTKIFSSPLKMFVPQKMVGVDIGTSSVKVVEISRWGGGKTLENYGEIKSESLYSESFRNSENSSFLLSDYFVSRAIRAVLDEAKIRTKAVIFSIPDFSTFCISFELPPMTEKELPQAIYYHAPQYIPLPVSETALDWKLISGVPGVKNSRLKIFLIAIPKQIVQEYQRVAEQASLELYAIEAEVLSITRSLVKDPKKTICLLDMGAQSTTINIVENKLLEKSYSFNFSSGQLTQAVSSILGVERGEAEDLKNNQGLLSKNSDIAKNLYLLIDPLILETKKICADFFQEEGRQIEKIYLTGGTALLPGLKEYISESIQKETETPNCFSDLLYPPVIEETLGRISPRFSVATGAALGGLDKL